MNCFTTEKICVLSVDPKAAELFHHMQRRIEKALSGDYKSESTIGGAYIMMNIISEKLTEIENKEDITILHAVESGSRAWGFASPDSDYDVRFIYIRKPEYYLKLEKKRDVIELPINDELDINGWDMDKTLRLLYKSNPTLFEWFSSPIIYRKTDFANRISPLLKEYFTASNSIYHYLGTAKSNYIAYIRNKDIVKAKKYFYVLRPLLACQWIMEHQCPPPMLFQKLKNTYIVKQIEADVDFLLDIKINSPEIKTIPAIKNINDYILCSMEEIQEYLQTLPKREEKSWNNLNKFFLSELNR